MLRVPSEGNKAGKLRRIVVDRLVLREQNQGVVSCFLGKSFVLTPTCQEVSREIFPSRELQLRLVYHKSVPVHGISFEMQSNILDLGFERRQSSSSPEN